MILRSRFCLVHGREGGRAIGFGEVAAFGMGLEVEGLDERVDS